MKNILAADRILANLQELNGFRTKLELAEYFGVGPSSITDWVRRKGNRIPERHLVRLAAERGLTWNWLAHGEGEPFEEKAVDAATGMELAPDEVRLLRRIKASPQFKKAVSRLLGLGEPEVALLAKVAESMARNPEATEKDDGQDAPFLKWNGRGHLTDRR